LKAAAMTSFAFAPDYVIICHDRNYNGYGSSDNYH